MQAQYLGVARSRGAGAPSDALSLAVRVVHIRHVRMGVLRRFMTVPMAVPACRHGLVHMVVMPIVVVVRVLVRQRLVRVLMAV